MQHNPNLVLIRANGGRQNNAHKLRNVCQKKNLLKMMSLPSQYGFFEKKALITMLNYRKERDIELKLDVSETTQMLYLY